MVKKYVGRQSTGIIRISERSQLSNITFSGGGGESVMVYSCFYYSLKIAGCTDQMVHQTITEGKYKPGKIRKVFSYCRCIITAIIVVMHTTSTILRASQDGIEFQLMISESLYIIGAAFNYLWMLFNLQKLIRLVNLMKTSFSNIDSKINTACKREERAWIVSVLILSVIGKIIIIVVVRLLKNPKFRAKDSS